jgi:hypothetical protein
MTRLTTLTLTALAGLAVGCADSLTLEEPTGKAMALVRLRDEGYALTFYSGLSKPERIVVSDDSTWQETWARIWAGRTPLPPLPEADFEKEMLVVAALGGRPTGGYGIVADSAFEDGDGLLIQVRTISPGTMCITTQAFTQPVDVARIPRVTGEISFRDRPEINECR